MKVYKITLLNDYSNVRLDQFPVKFVSKDSLVFGIIALFFGASFVLIPVAYLMKTLLVHEPIVPALSLMIVALLFLPLLLLGLKLISQKKEVVIDTTLISKMQANLFKKSEWQEPVCDYRGVLFRSNVELTGDDNSTLGYVVELFHENPQRTLCLFRSVQYAPAFEAWEYYCRVFNLPPMERVGKDSYIQRDMHTIGTPLIELIRQNPRLLHATPPPRPGTVKKTMGRHTETIELPDYTEIEMGETCFTIKQKSILSYKTTFDYSQVQAVVIDYSKIYIKWAWSVVILAPVPSSRMVIAHDLPYELLNWLQYYLIDKIIAKKK